MSTVSSTGSSSASMTDLMATMNAKSTSSSSSSSTSTSGLSGDASNFMTMLVAQLQNQDPLNPMDNSQMTSQLAQLQTVTGINNLNTTLTSLASSSGVMQATNMVGKGVLVAGNSVTLASGQGILGVNVGTAADDVKVAISDSNGNVVNTIDLGAQPAGSVPVLWTAADSTDSSGNKETPADGNYTFTVTATKNGQPLTDSTGLAYDTVDSVSTNATSGVSLYLASKGTTSLSDVKQVL